MASNNDKLDPLEATQTERVGFAEMYKLLEGVGSGGELQLVGPDGQSVEVPKSALYLLEQMAQVLARGDAISLVPVHKELTTQQAADILNVSRQYLVRLLDDGRIPFHRAGTHRRIRFDDLKKFKLKRDKERHQNLDELTRLTQEFGGYDDLP